MARGLAEVARRAAAGLARLRATVLAGTGGGKVRVMKGRVMAEFDSGDALGCTQLNKAQ
jgi:hypothetical protein